MESSQCLTSDNCVLFHEEPGRFRGKRSPNSDIVASDGVYQDSERRVTRTLIVEQTYKVERVRYPCKKLKKGLQGMQPLLGYRELHADKGKYNSNPLQLIFELPPDTFHESLANAIHSWPRPSILSKLKLCLDLARAVQTVHGLSLLHKKIRTRAILLSMSSDQSIPPLSCTLYLQDWAMARDPRPSERVAAEEIVEAIYQHPETQNRYAMVDYEAKHDIYSVGICMLQNILWIPFVLLRPVDLSDPWYRWLFDLTGGTPFVCDLFDGCNIAQASHPSIEERSLEIARAGVDDDELVQLISKCLRPGFKSATELVGHLEGLIAARKRASAT